MWVCSLLARPCLHPPVGAVSLLPLLTSTRAGSVRHGDSLGYGCWGRAAWLALDASFALVAAPPCGAPRAPLSLPIL